MEDKNLHKIPGAPNADDQLAIHSRVGRGLQGKSIRARITDDEAGEDQTYLHIDEYDPDTKEWTEDVVVSPNINGGRLQMYPVHNETSNPKTFTMTFRYTRNGRTEWSWVSPTIPYTQD